VVPNGVDIERFSRPADGPTSAGLRAKYGLSPDDDVAVSVSRLVEKNGLKKLLEAMPKIDIGRPVRLLLIGEGPMKEELSAMAHRLGIQTRVHFLGDIPNREVHNYLALADVFVRPSLSEGLGNAFLEAMAAGVPIVGSLAGGIADFLKDGETGFAVQPSDAEDIAGKMKLALTDVELRTRVIKNARALVSEKYTWAVVARAMGGVYTEISSKGNIV
jgi:glycosyltransferase involved in cell wall biosynthesis